MSDILNIKTEKIQTSVAGLNSTKQYLKGKLSTFISNRSGSFNEPIEFIITDKITGLTPNVTLDISEMKIPKFLELADPCFSEAKEIHALLNADVFCRIMRDNTYKVNEDLLFRETEFGWVAGGRLNEIKPGNEGSCFLLKNDSCIEDTLKLFFDLESLGIKDDPCFREEDQAMKLFKQTVRYENGRYIVELPFRKHWKELSDNLLVAKQRFHNLWKRLQRNKELYSQYKETIRDYLNQGIIEIVENCEVNNDKPIHYLPHQAIKKEGRVTTSTRIVFDAASHQANELSLNDCLWPGPNLNPNLLTVLINFRLNRIAVSSDIRQAFLQICLDDNHKDAVRFLWTDSNPSVEERPNLQAYRFKRVIFGVNASPFLLAATVKHHIEKYRNKYPTTVRHLDSFMYVDDWITGQDTREEAFLISSCAKNIMEEAGMVMRKWISNDSVLMSQWAAEGFDTYPVDTSVRLGTNKTKVLGMTWQTQDDCLTLDTKGLLEIVSSNKYTKRVLLQAIGKIFDPLGLLTPFTVRMKCLIQELWEKKFSWDEDLPLNIVEMWLAWCKELPLLDKLRIPRFILDSSTEENNNIEIHIFCDASKRAYGASVYVRVKKENKVLVNLVTSKSRVAPLKSITMPRLELLGALVAARLGSKVKEIISQKGRCTVFHWTDSKIVLFWIKGSSKRWKQFVANRVQEITRLTDPTAWYHCAGSDNPSDLLSRGLDAESLLRSEKWWNGPTFLQFDELVESVDNCTLPNEEEYLTELKKTFDYSSDSNKCLITTNVKNTVFPKILEISNNYLTLIHVLGYVFRFCHNLRNNANRRTGTLSSEEILTAEQCLIKSAQNEAYFDEICRIKNGRPVSGNSRLKSLNPFLDEKKVLRVSGRLKHSNLNDSQKYPIILPKDSKLTLIILEHYHKRFLHLGPQSLLCSVRQKFWPINGRNLCRKIVHNCITCFKNDPIMTNQIMGNLPKERLTQTFPFNYTGADFCGPFYIKYRNQRKGSLNKIYVCIFICLTTRAIHIETVSDLSTDAFIATLKRFFARRGKCAKLYTDNGRNFIGANAEIKRLHNIVKAPDEKLSQFLSDESIDWKFIPPRAPNFGGLWEAGVKSFKFHLKRVAGNQKLTLEEFLTLASQIEGILNSRPLTPLSSDFESFETLTPGHFLVGRPINTIIEPELCDINDNRLNRWQKTTKLVQSIWKLWKRDYLNNLQQRSRWMFEKNNVEIGKLVLIKEESLPVTQWLKGRITEVFPGSDNKIRVVNVKLPNGAILKRSVRNISILPVD